MAIQQFYLAVIPRSGLLKKRRKLPRKIIMDSVWRWPKSQREKYWALAQVNPNIIIPQIDKIVDRAYWWEDPYHIQWKTHTRFVDHDAWMYLCGDLHIIKEFSIRVDLRDKNLTYLHNMIELAKQHDWLFADEKGKLVGPNFEEIRPLLLASHAHRFLVSPQSKKYFEWQENSRG